MKVNVNFKTPDVLYWPCERLSLTDDELDAVKKIASRYISCDEYLTVCIDTEKDTMEIVKL